MIPASSRVATVLVLSIVVATPLPGQLPTVIRGRVEDAATRAALAGTRIETAGASATAFSDSNGEFTIAIPVGEPLTLFADQLGYRFDRFDLPPDAPSRMTVLRLEPEPLILDEVRVFAEADLDRVLRRLRERRLSYGGSAFAFDRARLQQLMPSGTAWDFVRERVPSIFECGSMSGLCVPPRAQTSLAAENPGVGVLVCIDGIQALSGATELGSLDLQSVALLEIYARGRGGIRVYTPQYLTSGHVYIPPPSLFSPGSGFFSSRC